MAWQYNKKVLATLTFHGAQTAWANLDGGTGWKQIKSGRPDGVTNLTVLLNSAHANGRTVHVDLDSAGLITTAYMI